MKHTITLTKKQRQVLEYIQRYFAEHEESPSIMDIQKCFSLSSTRSVTQYLDALTKKGYIERTREHRGMRLVHHYEENKIETVLIPLRGSASCGYPNFYADDNIEGYCSVDTKLLSSVVDNCFLLRARGTSMNNAGIDDMSLTLIERTDHFQNGDRVVAVIDGLATIKRFTRGDSSIVLSPVSSDDSHRPLILKDNFHIIGRVIDVVPDPKNFNEIRYEPENNY